MPVSAYFKGHGSEVMSNMEKEYGPEKAKRVFYATANKRKAKPKSMRSGGMVGATGVYKLHDGEMVLPGRIARHLNNMMVEHMMKGRFKKA